MEKTIREATRASGSPNHLPCQALETKVVLQLETSQTQHKRADQGGSNNWVQTHLKDCTGRATFEREGEWWPARNVASSALGKIQEATS